MAQYPRIKLTLPSGTEFVAEGNLSLTEIVTSNYQFERKADIIGGVADIAVGEKTGRADIVYTVGTGGSRRFNATFRKDVHDGLPWGRYNEYDDAMQLANELGDAFSFERVDTVAPATLTHGEYHPNGRYGELDVAIDEIEIPNDLERQQQSVEIRMNLREVIPKDDIVQAVP